MKALVVGLVSAVALVGTTVVAKGRGAGTHATEAYPTATKPTAVLVFSPGAVSAAVPSPTTAISSPPAMPASPRTSSPVVLMPAAASSRSPVVVAAHGVGEAPEPLCNFVRDLFGGQAIVVCPRGLPYDRDDAGAETYTFASSAALAREIDEGLDAAAAQLGSDVPPAPYTFVGFSLGAFLGVSVVADRPGRFDRAVFIEGGHDSWTEARARAFVAGGGTRVLFACGLPSCAGDAMRPLAMLVAAGGVVRMVQEEGAGHVFDGAVGASVRKALPWLLEGLPSASEGASALGDLAADSGG